MGHSSSVAVPVVDVEYPVSWVEVPYEPAAQEAQAPTIAYGARGARESERRVKSVTFLAEELAHASLEDVLKPDVFTVDDTGSSAWLEECTGLSGIALCGHAKGKATGHRDCGSSGRALQRACG